MVSENCRSDYSSFSSDIFFTVKILMNFNVVDGLYGSAYIVFCDIPL